MVKLEGMLFALGFRHVREFSILRVCGVNGVKSSNEIPAVVSWLERVGMKSSRASMATTWRVG